MDATVGVIWFLVTSFWLPTGEFKILGGGRFANEQECAAMAAADRKAKADMAGLTIECRHGAPKPPGLPDVQPHVPSRVTA